jgi:hypothetical protein
MRGRGVLALVALLAVVALAGCPPNEAKVCGSKSTNAGASCSATYDLCNGGSDRLECAPAGTGVTCTCLENGTKNKTFQSADACNVTPDTLKKRAAEGCGWDILDED